MKESKYLEFKFKESKPKTSVWQVLSKSDKAVLGEIKWFPQWRQYCFFPWSEVDIKEIKPWDITKANVLIKQMRTVFSVGCMLDIISFINDLKKVKE